MESLLFIRVDAEREPIVQSHWVESIGRSPFERSDGRNRYGLARTSVHLLTVVVKIAIMWPVTVN